MKERTSWRGAQYLVLDFFVSMAGFNPAIQSHKSRYLSLLPWMAGLGAGHGEKNYGNCPELSKYSALDTSNAPGSSTLTDLTTPLSTTME